MALLRTVGIDEAQGAIKEVYDLFLGQLGSVPAPLHLMTASPRLFNVLRAFFGAYRGHPTLPFPLLTTIRYLVAVDQQFEACVKFNEGILRRVGMTDDDLAALRADPRRAPFEPREQELLAFVMRVVRDREPATAEMVDALRTAGWSDADVLDACWHGADLVAKGLVVRGFAAESLFRG